MSNINRRNIRFEPVGFAHDMPALRFYWMAFITVSGEPAARHEELARIAALRLNCELVTDARLVDTIGSEFGTAQGIPDKAWPHLALSILARLGTEHHLVISSIGSELLFRNLPGVLRVHVSGYRIAAARQPDGGSPAGARGSQAAAAVFWNRNRPRCASIASAGRGRISKPTTW